MKRRSFLPLGLLVLLLPSTAQAQCAARYALGVLAQDLGTMQSALRSLDEAAFKAAGERLATGLPCMATPAPAPVYGATYRMLGAWYYVSGDTDEARRWFSTAHELDPSFEWDIHDFDVGHPIRILYEDLQRTVTLEPLPVDGRALSLPAGSTLLIDGRPLEAAEATPDRPHVVQQVGTDKAIRNTWIVDGNGFPAAILQSATEAGPEPAVAFEEGPVRETRRKRQDDPPQAVGTGPDDDVVLVKRVRPPLKTPLLVLGGAGLLAAGGTYGASFLAREEFEVAGTSDEVHAARTATNTLVLAAGGIAAVSLGVGYVGILLDGGVGLGLGGSF